MRRDRRPRALVGLPEVRRLHPPGARQELAAARLAELAEAALPTGAADGAFAFFTLSGDTPLHGVAVVRDAVAVCALSPLPLHSLLHARLGANAAALFPSWTDAEFGADGALAQLQESLAAAVALDEDILAVGEAFDARPLLVAAGRDLLRTLKLLALETRLLVRAARRTLALTLPAGAASAEPPPQLASAALLALASLVPHGLVPAAGAPPTTMATMTRRSCRSRRRTRGGRWRRWRCCPALASGTPPSCCRATAPAGARPRRTARRARSWRRSRTRRSRSSRMAAAASRRRASRCSTRRWRRRRRSRHREGLARHWSMACRAARGDDGAWVDGGGWEGSAEWLRQQIHDYFGAVARAAARQVLAGSAAELQQQHGVAWVGRWAATRSFAGWAARNGLQAACRLWRVRLDASTAEAEAEAAAARRPPPRSRPPPSGRGRWAGG